MPTGEVEVVASKIWILNESRTPPFPMEEHVDVAEDVRLKYRYVDLRRPQHAAQHHPALEDRLRRARVSAHARRASWKSRRRS
jgi:aspartyl-tRNA synthetase